MALLDAQTPGSDDWWLVKCGNEFGAGLKRMAKLQSYRDGKALLPENMWDSSSKASYLRFLERARLHVVETIRDSRTNRQGVVGFRTAAEQSSFGDPVAWEQWNRQHMDVLSRDLFNDVGDFGRAYVLVVPQTWEGPRWQVLNEWTTYGITDKDRPWSVKAGIHYQFNEILEREELTLFMGPSHEGPGFYRTAVREARVSTLPQDGNPWSPGTNWDWIEERQTTDGVVENLLTKVSTTDGYGIYEKHLDTVDRINEITLNAINLIVMQSFKQRAVKGDLPQFYPEDFPDPQLAGKRINYDEVFETGAGALWMLPVGADMWESTVTDVTPVYMARKQELQTLCSLTSTPQDLFAGESQNQSALGAQISREPLFYAVSAMNERAGDALEQVMATTFSILGDVTRSDSAQIETMWKKVTPATMAEKAEAAAKYRAGGAPQEFIDTEVFEMSPLEQRRVRSQRANDQFARLLSGADSAAVTETEPVEVVAEVA